LQKFVTHDKFLQQKIVMGDKFLQSVVLVAMPGFCRFLSPMTSFCKDRQVILLNSGVKRCRIRTSVLLIGGGETATGVTVVTSE